MKGKDLSNSISMEPIGDISNPESLNPDILGFMCGLEIHQQLDTGKLHSRMPSKLFDYKFDEIPPTWKKSARKLRAARGEGGKIDVAARFEHRRNRSFIYFQSPNASLIELDEAPPDTHDNDAVDVVLTISAMMNAKPVTALQAMRKTVVDGSNTSGFQRTTLIANQGVLETKSGNVGIDVICLEEDSARKLITKKTSNGDIVYYNLDRLGIPLVEIATAPDIVSPEHAKESAIKLGTLLRDTRRVRRGLGSIRQDLNVSISCGDRVEIKGCQDLEWIPKIIRLEMARQIHMYRLANELRSEANLPKLSPNRSNDKIPIENRVALHVKSKIKQEIHDVTELFLNCESSMLQNSISNHEAVKCVILPGFAGKLGSKKNDINGSQLPRLGRELASAAKLAGVAGIFHSDELPAYGITDSDVNSVVKSLSLSDEDAFVLCVAPDWQSDLALESVLNRARLAYHRITQEVRNVVIRKGQPDDGTTTAMRPLPGGARMYPETDVPILNIKKERWQRILNNLPLTQQERYERISEIGVSDNQIDAVIRAELDDVLIQGIEGKIDDSIPPLPAKAWATAILENPETIPFSVLASSIHLRESNLLTREGVVPISKLAMNSNISNSNLVSWMQEKISHLGYSPANADDVEVIIDETINEMNEMVKDRGFGAIGPLMGIVMKKLGGTADGKLVNKLLKTKIEDLI
ncbi:MAG: Glu-tRNA(Gln) amidotransferase GatDE subunit E [Euryarchaeota archaeon]|nr:Glu-tRNA(Gln) amidotransferase GatDE subunit E [Euryarchaeota archaeon]|tara:strand:+ start:30916 stop:33000 length:2085 start_codon:yes stop_codon:yes gene_type:complete